MAADAGLDRSLGFLRPVPEPARVLRPDQALQLALRSALAAAELSAVASRGAPAGAPRLQEHHVVASLGQVQGRRQPGEPAADYADVAGYRAPEARMFDITERGGGEIGVGMG